MSSIWVTIPTVGTWPSASELSTRNAVTDALNATGIGTCTGAGGGMGEMDFSFRIEDEKAARSAIETVMQSLMPGVRYHIRLAE